jgi:hypothetical protein
VHGVASLNIKIENQAAIPDIPGIPGTGQPGSPVYHGGAGARNRGLGNEGFYLQGGKDYEGYLYARVPEPLPAPPGTPPAPPPLLEVSLEGDDLRTLAAQQFVVNWTNGTEWTKLNFKLIPNETTTCASGEGDLSVYCGTYEGLPSAGHACIRCGGGLKLRLLRGSITIDFVVLMPGAWGRLHDKTGKPLPVLKTGADVLQQMGTKVIRQGGEIQTVVYSSRGSSTAVAIRCGTTCTTTINHALFGTLFGTGSYVCDSGTGHNGDTPANASYYEWQKWTGPPEFRPTVGAHWVKSLIGGWGPLCVTPSTIIVPPSFGNL